MQFLLVIENLHTHCLGLIAPILEKITPKIFTIKRCYQRVTQGGIPKGELHKNFINNLDLSEAKIQCA